MLTIDLNCDMGEGFGPWPMGNDAALMQHITSANIACGFHAGDPLIMQKTVGLALAHGVAIGAHPGYPDLQGFGRRQMQLTPAEVYAQVLYQIGALQAIAQAAGGRLHHVKPHGALYNTAAKDRALADAIARAVQAAGGDLMLYGLSGSALIEAAQAIGLRYCSEVFADRRYERDGSLTPRSHPEALLEDVAAVVAQALELVREQRVRCRTGEWVALRAETLCLHGDGPQAEAFAQALFQGLQQAGIEITNKK